MKIFIYYFSDKAGTLAELGKNAVYRSAYNYITANTITTVICLFENTIYLAIMKIVKTSLFSISVQYIWIKHVSNEVEVGQLGIFDTSKLRKSLSGKSTFEYISIGWTI